MAYENKRKSRNDRFGNEYQLARAFWNDNGFAKAHIEIKGKLYAIEFGTSSKDDEKTGRAFTWVRVTAKKTQPKVSGSF